MSDEKPDEAKPQLRRITDARTLRALTHPVRLALIETLGVYGPMTATEAGERIAESPTTCSFHLRQLAKYGFVEEAGGGKGRARPWKMTSLAIDIPEPGDMETEIAASALARLFRERAAARYQDWLGTRHSYPRAWREAAGESQSVMYVTADELKALREELTESVLLRFHGRLTDPSKRPPGAAPVELLMLTFPVEPPADS